MADSIERLPVRRITREGGKNIRDTVTRELPLTIIFNNRELVTLLCSPVDLRYLAIGFLTSGGLIGHRDEIKGILADDSRGVVRVETGDGKDPDAGLLTKRLITSGCGKGTAFYNVVDVKNRTVMKSDFSISPSDVFTLVREFQNRSQLFKSTGGVHSAALCDAGNILVFNEDIGRHNALDKVFGECLWEDIPTADRLIVTSGRVSSEILLKVARRDIPVLVSRSAPTDLGIKLANDLGVTLVGFVRGERMNVYSHERRITA
ncbi:formate dehydrogenase accessory sulfurtransferase FdhD [Chloroflexota bacterium]